MTWRRGSPSKENTRSLSAAPIAQITVSRRTPMFCELNVSCLESRRLEVRCGLKKQGDTKKNYVHMLK